MRHLTTSSRVTPLLAGLLLLLAGPGLAWGQEEIAAGEAFTVTGLVQDADDGTPLQYTVVGIPELGTWAQLWRPSTITVARKRLSRCTKTP